MSKFHVRTIILSSISLQRASWSGWVNFRNGFRTWKFVFIRSLYALFSKILCVVDDSYIYIYINAKGASLRSEKMTSLRFASLRFAREKDLLKTRHRKSIGSSNFTVLRHLPSPPPPLPPSSPHMRPIFYIKKSYTITDEWGLISTALRGPTHWFWSKFHFFFCWKIVFMYGVIMS